jgi:hypothetical protein
MADNFNFGVKKRHNPAGWARDHAFQDFPENNQWGGEVPRKQRAAGYLNPGGKGFKNAWRKQKGKFPPGVLSPFL